MRALAPTDLGVSGRDGDRAGSGDGGLVGAEVGLDDAGVVEDLGGRALGDDGAELERHHAVAEPREERHVVLDDERSEDTSELQALMRIPYSVFGLKKK